VVGAGLLHGSAPEGDDCVLHGWIGDGEVRLVGPWIPEVFRPFGGELLCTEAGLDRLVEIGACGRGGEREIAVVVADGGVGDAAACLSSRRLRMSFRLLRETFARRSKSTRRVYAPQLPTIECDLAFERHEGIEVAVTRPRAVGNVALGWLVKDGDRSFGCGMIPRLWIADGLWSEFCRLYPGWFRVSRTGLEQS
jgi:hypothetical protein